VRQVLDEIEQGGLADAIIRAGILVVKAGGGKRRLAQMEHTRALLAPTGVLRHIDEDELRRLLHEETLVVEFEPRRAKATLPKLVKSADDRQKLHRFFDSLESDVHLDPRQHTLLAELRRLVPRPPLQLASAQEGGSTKAKGNRKRALPAQ
jgi:hypothetical protein